MGCDIHAMIERRSSPQRERWVNSGNPDICRNYYLFTLLAGVRSSGREHIEQIAPLRGVPYWPDERDFSLHVCREYAGLVEHWSVDGHSHSWVLLSELRGKTLPGYGQDGLDRLIGRMELWEEGWRSDDDIRLVFFFDN